MGVLSELKPKTVFTYFEELCAIPHGSGNTKKISDYLASFAKEHGLRYIQDEKNNIIIFKKASAGYEAAPPVILQGHMDMVCVQEAACTKDMTLEGLDLATDGEYVWANGTSLGADNGVAVAACMALLTDHAAAHPPLEIIFTVDEENGMHGAKALDTSVLSARRMINLDSGEEGVFTVGCAGGACCDVQLDVRYEPVPNGFTAIGIWIDGLKGGHSGVEIDKGRGNANALFGRLLYNICHKCKVMLAKAAGGRADNVITPLNESVVLVPKDQKEMIAEIIEEFDHVSRSELAATDGGVHITYKTVDMPDCAVNETDTKRIADILFALPQGVQAMSFEAEGLVQTSVNLGIIQLTDSSFKLCLSVRSNMESQKEMMIQKIGILSGFGNGRVSVRDIYPAWEICKESPLRDIVLEAYEDVTGKAGRITAIHGGLECGIFSAKIPGLDCVAMTPVIFDAHSPNERLKVASMQIFYDTITRTLSKLH